MSEPDEPLAPLGLEVCRLALDLGRGRIGHPRQVGIAIRAANFVELALDGRLVGRNWPEAQGDSETGQAMPDAVHRTVIDLGPIRWRHWFNHVDADRRAATGRLVTAGTWREEGRRLVDLTDGRTLVDQQRVRLAFEQDEPPATVREATLVLLLGGAGGSYRPMPRRARGLTRTWLPPLLRTSGRGGDAIGSAVLHALAQMVRAAPVRMLSR